MKNIIFIFALLIFTILSCKSTPKTSTSEEIISAEEIIIEDDGNGFTDIEQVTKAYYHSNLQDDYKHFGLGMYISNVYCEKHGGKLFVANKESGGALVKAVFHFL